MYCRAGRMCETRMSRQAIYTGNISSNMWVDNPPSVYSDERGGGGEKKKKKITNEEVLVLLNDQHWALEIILKKGCQIAKRKKKNLWKKKKRHLETFYVCVGLLIVWRHRIWGDLRHRLVTFIFKGHFQLLMEERVRINKKHFQKSHWLVGAWD